MSKKRLLCALLIMTFIATFASSALAVEETTLVRADSYLAPPGGKPPKPEKPNKPAKTKVDIRNIASGDVVFSKVLVIAEVTGEFSSIWLSVDGSEYLMAQVGATDRYQVLWDTAGLSGVQTVTVKATSETGELVASDSVQVSVASDFVWEIYLEIDWIVEPPLEVLCYLVEYWEGHAIRVLYEVDDEVSDPTPDDGYISSSDFWAIESSSNDGEDQASGGAAPKYTLKDKWMLYGTWDEDPNVGGYTYVLVEGKDLLAGNYMFIAAEMINNWEETNSIPDDGGEVIVVCHESGHSIGIAVLRGPFEKYDSDLYSVMSYMRTENAALMAGYWYYSKEYWETANLGYY